MKNTWNELINKITDMYTLGKSEAQISEQLSNSVLFDIGIVERVIINSEYSGFIQLNMPRIKIPYQNKIIIGDFLALNFTTLNERDFKSSNLQKRANFHEQNNTYFYPWI